MIQHIKYELLEVERTIADGQNAPGQKLKTVGSLDQQLEAEVERIKQTLTHEVFSFEDERHLERYIQFHQMAVIRLLDKIDSQRQTHPAGRKDPHRIIYTHLDSILRLSNAILPNILTRIRKPRKATWFWRATKQPRTAGSLQKLSPTAMQTSAWCRCCSRSSTEWQRAPPRIRLRSVK